MNAVFDREAQDLRDMHAAAALAGGLGQALSKIIDLSTYAGQAHETTWTLTPKEIAARAYAIANAMLEERAK